MSTVRILKPNQDTDYHQFLNSSSRDHYLPDNIYKALVADKQEEVNVLVYHCGLGYIPLKIAEYLKKEKNNRIYGCDYFEDILDLAWQKIAKKKIDNVTLFYMPDRARIVFPGWVPPMQHIFLNMSLSLNEDPLLFLQCLKSGLAANGILHILEWNKNKSDEKLDQLYPQDIRLALEQTQEYLTKAGYTITKTINPDKFFYAFSAVALS